MFLTVLDIPQVLNKWHEAPRRYRLDGCERPCSAERASAQTSPLRPPQSGNLISLRSK